MNLAPSGRTRPRNPARAPAGFSLIELVYVLLIVGVLVSMAVPRIDFERARVDSAATRIASELMRAQRVAVLRQHDVRVSFDDAELRLIIHEDGDNDGAMDEGEPTRIAALEDGTRFGRVGAALFGSGDAITFEDDAAALPTVVFHRNGSASEEGAIHVTSVSPTGAEHDRSIRLTRATGMARCWTRRSGPWTEGC